MDIAQVDKKVPFAAAYLAGWLLEMVYRLVRIKGEPKMTRFLALQLARSHYFSHKSAELDFGYKPEVNIESGMARVVEWLNQ